MLHLFKSWYTVRSVLEDIKTNVTPKEVTEIAQKEMEERRKALMKRGLPKQKPIKGVKQILLVASGKGGVGKSTTAVNLSIAIKHIAPKKSVGLLDTDLFGPSIPILMNIHESPIVNEENFMVPLINYGIKCMSMGFLIDDKSPVMWRGLMVMSALEKLIYQVAWSPLDYLIVDTPPGTGDTHLSLVQNLIITGVLLVTTPEKGALEVTGRGAKMFQKLDIPIAGIVENMSFVTCPQCTNEIFPFGKNTQELTQELGVPIIGKIPLHHDGTDSSNSGKPILISAPNSAQAEAYRSLAKHILSFLNQRADVKQ